MCPVCYGETRVYFPCGHGLCRACTQRWFAANQTCPVCRDYVGVNLSSTSTAIDSLLRLRRRGYETTSVFMTCEGSTTLLKKNKPFKYNNGTLQSTE